MHRDLICGLLGIPGFDRNGHHPRLRLMRPDMHRDFCAICFAKHLNGAGQT